LTKLQQILHLPFDFLMSQFFWLRSEKQKLPGKHFFSFGRSTAVKLLRYGLLSPKLLLNPVSIVRYFEYDFALKSFSLRPLDRVRVLDISSPYLFGFNIASSFDGEYKYINPDKTDLAIVKKYSSKLRFKMTYLVESADATN